MSLYYKQFFAICHCKWYKLITNLCNFIKLVGKEELFLHLVYSEIYYYLDKKFNYINLNKLDNPIYLDNCTPLVCNNIMLLSVASVYARDFPLNVVVCYTWHFQWVNLKLFIAYVCNVIEVHWLEFSACVVLCYYVHLFIVSL